ncbi:Regulator of g-protein signaling [Apiospora phragmitis]|uniref:Regulator of g-protein signaling n=1 Tax=Apiospora phragmitis TaxID=2905665 RepID=A0ABR1WVK5_9PEZI
MGKSRLRGSSPTYLTPSPRAISPPSSVCEDWDIETAMSTSRPTSLAIPRTGSPAAKLPSLSEILSNTASPPWTLSAFTAYLSQNHCLETLEIMMQTYITPYGSREVNLPAPVRDRLLALSQSLPKPPTPSELNEAVTIVQELMSDSVLVPFCQSATVALAEQQQQAADESREDDTAGRG